MVALAPGQLLRQLLRQQLLGLEPRPGGVAAVFQFGQRHLGWRGMQEKERIPQIHHAQMANFTQIFNRNALGVLAHGPRQAGAHGLAQIGLRQARTGGVHGRERLGQRAACGLEHRMHHLTPPQPRLELTAHPHPLTHRQCLEVAGVKRQKAQHTGCPALGHGHAQLAARPR